MFKSILISTFSFIVRCLNFTHNFIMEYAFDIWMSFVISVNVIFLTLNIYENSFLAAILICVCIIIQIMGVVVFHSTSYDRRYWQNTVRYSKVELKSGIAKIWQKGTYFHRTDGPAIIWYDGDREWWVDGNRCEGPGEWFYRLNSEHKEQALWNPEVWK